MELILLLSALAAIDWTAVPARSASDGKVYSIPAALAQSRATVVLFFSADCPVQEAHDQRLRALATQFAAKGVTVLLVDSEADSSLERDVEEARRRHFAFPILSDRDGAIARALGAEFATEAFVFDRAGAQRYHGGIDSDKTHLRPDARQWLREAVESVSADKAVAVGETKPFGCYLRRK
jgi:peroxiredoxin